MSTYLDMGNIPSYGKAFRSETEISSARGLDGLSKLLNSVLISQSYKTATSAKQLHVEGEVFTLNYAFGLA